MSHRLSTQSLFCVTCNGCNEPFSNENEAKCPKNLKCHHTFCCECLSKRLEGNIIKCPTNPNCKPTTVKDGDVKTLGTNFALAQIVTDAAGLFGDKFSLLSFDAALDQLENSEEAEKLPPANIEIEAEEPDEITKLRRLLRKSESDNNFLLQIQNADKENIKKIQEVSEAEYNAKLAEVAAYYDSKMKILETDKNRILEELSQQRKPIKQEEKMKEENVLDEINMTHLHDSKIQRLKSKSDEELLPYATDVQNLNNLIADLKTSSMKHPPNRTELFVDLPEYNFGTVGITPVHEINCKDYSADRCLSRCLKTWLQQNLLFLRIKKQNYEQTNSANNICAYKNFYKVNDLVVRFKFGSLDKKESWMSFTTPTGKTAYFTAVKPDARLSFTIEFGKGVRTYDYVDDAFNGLVEILL